MPIVVVIGGQWGDEGKGRIVDLSPFTAKSIGLTPEQGLAKVAVTPITVALPDGSVKLGAAGYELQADARESRGRGG